MSTASGGGGGLPALSAVVLAGGRGTRLGGADKGLVRLRGRPLVEWVLARLRPQVDELFVSANRNGEIYAAYGHRVLRDAECYPAGGARDPAGGGRDPAGGAWRVASGGPLAGVLAALEAARHDLVLAVPCDTPFLPLDLAAELRRALLTAGADLAVAAAGGRTHHAVMLCHRRVATPLAAFLAAGGRRLGEWQARSAAVTVEFADARAFCNVNSPTDLAFLEGPPGAGGRADLL